MPDKVNLLIVDDDKDMGGILKTILDETGEYEAFVANNSKEALKLVKNKHIDIVLIDLVLKESKNGVEVFREIRSISPGVKGILFTGYGMGEEMGVKAMKEGLIDEILPKMIHPAELIKAIGKYKGGKANGK